MIRRAALALACGAALASTPVQAQQAAEAPESEAGSENVHRVDAVVVTGSRTERSLGEAPVATEVISREEIQESGARDAAELLEDRPGVHLERGFAGAAIELEGLPADYTLILVNGVRVPGRVNGVIDLSRFATENIERIEIVRGAGSALYGSDAIAGVVNIITRAASRPLELNGSANVGAFGRFDVTGGAGTKGKVGSLRVSGGRHSSEGFDLDPSDPATTQPAFQQYDVSQRSSLNLARGFRLDS